MFVSFIVYLGNSMSQGNPNFNLCFGVLVFWSFGVLLLFFFGILLFCSFVSSAVQTSTVQYGAMLCFAMQFSAVQRNFEHSGYIICVVYITIWCRALQ